MWGLSQKENLPTFPPNLHLFIWVIWNVKSKKWERHSKTWKCGKKTNTLLMGLNELCHLFRFKRQIDPDLVLLLNKIKKYLILSWIRGEFFSMLLWTPRVVGSWAANKLNHQIKILKCNYELSWNVHLKFHLLYLNNSDFRLKCAWQEEKVLMYWNLFLDRICVKSS